MSYSSKQVFASEAAALFLENFREALLDSPSHPPGDQSSSNNESLDKHQRDCPVQLPSLEATSSGQSLASEEAPQQHLEVAPQQHLLNSKPLQEITETPLDTFFKSYSNFPYDPLLSPATSFALLRQHMDWQRHDAASKEAWEDYQHALHEELRLWFGSANDITAWHALCRAVGFENPRPTTTKACVEAMKGKHVNIVDLIDWGRHHEVATTK